MVQILALVTIVLLAICSTAKSIPISEGRNFTLVSGVERVEALVETDNVKPPMQKRFYVGTFFKANWHEASKYCRHRGMLLASINSEEEQQDLEAVLDMYGNLDIGYVWISGTNVNESNGAYVWKNGRTETSMAYTKWMKGEPTDTCGDSVTDCCVSMGQNNDYGYGWVTYRCNHNYYFVCENSDPSECSNL